MSNLEDQAIYKFQIQDVIFGIQILCGGLPQHGSTTPNFLRVPKAEISMELPIETMNFIRRENPDSTNSCGVFVQSRSLMADG